MKANYCNLASPYCSGAARDKLLERLAAADRDRKPVKPVAKPVKPPRFK